MEENKRILLFGEIVWDDIVPGGGSGKPENIGGASFNAAVHCRRLGMESAMISALGEDKLGEKTFEFVRESGVDTAYIARSQLPTCLITVAFNEKGEPAYTIPPDVSWDDIVLLEPKQEEDGIILEFKVQDTEDEKDLADTVKAALAQIEKKNYEAVLVNRGIPKERIRKYGFAFCGKKVLIGRYMGW